MEIQSSGEHLETNGTSTKSKLDDLIIDAPLINFDDPQNEPLVPDAATRGLESVDEISQAAGGEVVDVGSVDVLDVEELSGGLDIGKDVRQLDVKDNDIIGATAPRVSACIQAFYLCCACQIQQK